MSPCDQSIELGGAACSLNVKVVHILELLEVASCPEAECVVLGAYVAGGLAQGAELTYHPH